MKYAARPASLAVLEQDYARACDVVRQALDATFGGPDRTVRAFMEVTLVVRPTQDAPRGPGCTAAERAA